ncbi:hypothetical protein Sme01_38770 [Sphaerisporangium melleum]|uniref:Glycosyltransferase n=1 Tax=Sphaerisporangium melleum TaxID=321316 RepID=A0A917VI41_9ACTN|nr:hypothetical protein [Sphaerisporangium melleum]GGK85591.1 hypothetical protein GCM10007964_30180 [Sphaerisporangium melleum]GII71401.1 hypothetical protein Sme01_38770 [Sphaerisporangium melleum]
MNEELESTRRALEAAVAAASGAAELTRLLADYQERLARAAASEAEALTRLREAEAKLKTTERQVTQLAKNLAEQRYQTEAAQWRLESVQASRWSKLGDAIHTKNPGQVARTLRAPISKRPAPKRSDFKPAPPAVEAPPVQPVTPQTAGPEVSTAMAEGFVVPKGPLTRPYLTVAAIVDRQSEALFRYEWRQVTNFGPDNWQAMLDQHRPHLLFVESVRPGPRQGNGGRWLEELAGNARGLRDLVEECSRRGIRTVFWHSGGPLSAAVPMASYFDHVLATSEARAREWRAALRHDRVGILPHAVQPRVHNRIRAAGDRHGVGLLGTALQGDLPADAGWRPLITDAATYDDLLTTYREVEMVLAGPDADARTVEEISACGTPIMQLTGPVDQASLPRTMQAVRDNLAADAECAAEAHLAWRSTASVTPLLDPLLDTVGLPSVRNAGTITAIAAVTGPAELDHLLAQLAGQSRLPGQLVIVADGLDAAVVAKAARDRLAEVRSKTPGTLPADHPAPGTMTGGHQAPETRAGGHDPAPGTVADGPAAPVAGSPFFEDLIVRQAGTPLTRGAALDRALRLADGDLVAVLDPRDLYGEHYLADLARYFTAVDAEIVGKASFYAHITDTGATVLRQPGADHRFLPEVAGGTLLARRPALVELGIADVSEEWDEVLMRQCRTDGVRVYSADRYSYVCRRPATEGRLLASAHFEGYVHPTPLALI